MNRRVEMHRRFPVIFVVLSLVLGNLALANPARVATAQTTTPQVKPVVVYPDYFAESASVNGLSQEPVKESLRFPAITPPPPQQPSSNGKSEGTDSGGSLDETPPVDGELIYEEPLYALPKDALAAPGDPLSGLAEGLGLTESGQAELLGQDALQTMAAVPGPLVSFDGNSSQDNFNAFGFRVSPPDTNGDVGPNHYVQMTNLLVRVWDKNGNPLTPPFKLSSLFAPLGGQCAAPDAGDPIVLYDPLADRWLLSQFAFVSTSAPPYHQCIAISKTGDPTGGYWLYDFITPGNEFPDYPKLGVWPDAYYMTTNQFLNGGNFDGAGAFAFDRTKMLNGDPTAGMVYFNLNLASHPEGIGGMLPSDLDGNNLPAPGQPNTFAYFLANEFGDALDGLRLFDFDVDFVNPVNSTFTERPESPLPVAAFNPANPAGRSDISQPGTTTGLDSISDRLLHRLQYRIINGVEYLVTNHTVNVSGGTTQATYRAGVRWYQLARSGGGSFTVYDQGTFAPADTASRWMGSAALNANGDLAIGYTASGASTYPSVRYAGRLAFDPPGTMQDENSIIEGTGSQTGSNRWGDYSMLAVDPVDDCTFWFTSEYMTAAGQASSSVGWQTRIGSFRLGSCTPADYGTLEGHVYNALDNSPVSGALVQIGSYSAGTDSGGYYSRNLPTGSYSVTVSKFGFQPAAADVTITQSATTVQDFMLDPLPVMQGGPYGLVSEGFQPGNGAPDPAETVTVNLTVTNIGPGPTTNLQAELLNTGGVQNSSGSVTYGVVGAGGGTGTQPFTFRVDPTVACGATITATLHLTDGALDLGSVTYTIQTGAQSVALSENFDGVTTPALPSGWNATVAAGLSTNLWRTATTLPDTAPNAAFAPDPSTVHDLRLDTPVFTISGSGSTITFRNNYATESGFDGGVLEISINGGAFTDILAAGGSFVSGGYNRTISSSFGSPIAGRQAWSGSSSGYVTSIANLPAAAAGQNVQLRFRMASDSSVSGTGWRVDTIQVASGFTCAYDIVANGSTVLLESFSPVNGVLDPGEKVKVAFGLKNKGSASTVNLQAELLTTGGVLAPDGPATYGVLNYGGGTGAQPFTFRVDPTVACGATITATLHLYDGDVDLGNRTFNFTLGTIVQSLSENFDGVTTPALPSGWNATVAAGLSTNLWRTATTLPDTAPNAAFAPDPSTVHDLRLDTPVFPVTAANAQLIFRNNYATESGFDGGVLEISINGGAFTDILAAGGSFVSGGYNRTISSSFGSPIAGRQAWSGSSSGYVTSIANLPAAAAGQNVQLRFRMASDSSVSGTGWRVDTIQVFGGYACAANAAPSVTVSSASQSVQYSDPISPVTVSASDTALSLPLAFSAQWNKDGGAFQSGLPSDLTLTGNSCSESGNNATCTQTLSGQMMTVPGIYIVRVTVTDADGEAASRDVTITVTKEDARVTYTGTLFTTTNSPTSSAATVLLSATIQDISITADAAGDTYPGDIRNATVTFVNRDTNTNLAGCVNLPVGLVNAADTRTGSASCNYAANIGSANSQTLTVGVIVNNSYTRNSQTDNALVTISKPLSTNFASGGGYLNLTNSSGLKSGDAGSKNNFGFNVKYNKGGTNLQGSATIIVRRTEADGIQHVYQIKSNSLTMLSVNTATKEATLTTKATIKDITNPAAVVTVDGNATLTMSMKDFGEPGSSDTVSVTVLNKAGGVWFTSNWNGVKTLQQVLGGGNLFVR